MVALRRRCPVDEHRVLYDPQEPNIDREINKSWLRSVCRNSRFLLRFSVSSTVVMNSLVWTGMYPTRVVLSFSLIPRVISFSTLYLDVWLRRDLSLPNALKKRGGQRGGTVTWLLTSHFHTRNDSKWGCSTENPYKRSKYVNRRSNRRVWPKIRLTDRLSEIHHSRPYNNHVSVIKQKSWKS